jgi:hypothetical protein
MTESRSCAATDALLDADAAGRLDEGGRSALRSHLAACAACLDRAVALHPALLFLELGAEPVPAATWDRFQERLRARLADRAAARPWRAAISWPRLAWAAPAAMVLILGVTLFVVGPGRQRPGGWQRPRPARPPLARPAPGAPHGVPGAIPGAPQTPTAPGGAAGFPSDGSGPAGAPVMEGVAAPGARVYRFSVGEPGEETPIYFIVDESIDL